MKAASQGERPSGSSRPNESGISGPVLLPDPIARLGRHRPPLLIDAEGDLLEVLLAAHFAIPLTEDLAAIPPTSEAARDRFDPALFACETAEICPLILFAVELTPELHDACARPVTTQNVFEIVREVTWGSRWLRFTRFRLHSVLHSAGQIR